MTVSTMSQIRNSKRKQVNSNSLPPIPDKRYFTIGEVGLLCGVKPHVLRYWEQEFPRLRPAKRRGNRRYYQHKDIVMARQIRQLLYEDGFTIEGARAQLAADTHVMSTPSQDDADIVIKAVIAELENILQALTPRLA